MCHNMIKWHAQFLCKQFIVLSRCFQIEFGRISCVGLFWIIRSSTSSKKMPQTTCCFSSKSITLSIFWCIHASASTALFNILWDPLVTHEQSALGCLRTIYQWTFVDQKLVWELALLWQLMALQLALELARLVSNSMGSADDAQVGVSSWCGSASSLFCHFHFTCSAHVAWGLPQAEEEKQNRAKLNIYV